MSQLPPAPAPRKYMTVGLFAIFLGTFGVDRFYLGKTGSAIAKLLTCGGCGVWALVDVILLLTGSTRDAQGQPLADETPKNRRNLILIYVGVVILSIISSVINQAALASLQAGFNAGQY